MPHSMARPDVRIGTPATDRQIEAAEVQLGRLPADYRAFLHDFGWAAFGHWEIFGAGDEGWGSPGVESGRIPTQISARVSDPGPDSL